jgi:hypothetical protein
VEAVEYRYLYDLGDPIVEKVMGRMADRSQAGLKKYGVTMLRDDVSTVEWLRHAQEEALDFAVYIERIIHDIENQSRPGV